MGNRHQIVFVRKATDSCNTNPIIMQLDKLLLAHLDARSYGPLMAMPGEVATLQTGRDYTVAELRQLRIDLLAYRAELRLRRKTVSTQARQTVLHMLVAITGLIDQELEAEINILSLGKASDQ